ncbi:glycosyltransferase family 32 protein [Anaerocolumna sp. MB42-C2]|uniref:glycosyltransferase family 32 protein n=1 Tax=Anaerocolumna sp. MB42-C2 TaxID=3070997 RepID=UPI0027DEADAE|nr:glycosyltransferase [Anaerocolumna sp. MB42-C2]WMJ85813.1 glycosyltransferase [Anaerocolumna sp. MB42-C2]
MSIPKIIHYCWFGENEKSYNTVEFIKKWRLLNPDFEIKEWNETNFDVNINAYVREAYNAQKWAFVSDFARLYALYNYGGIYLDTDVDEVKSFNSLLNHVAFIGTESQFSMCTATIGSEMHSKFIKEIMDSYNEKHFIFKGEMDTIPNSQRIYQILSNNYRYKYSENVIQNLGVCIVYPSDYFSPINCYTYREEITDNTISIHRYAGTWKSRKEKRKDKIMGLLTRVIGENRRDAIKKMIKNK